MEEGELVFRVPSVMQFIDEHGIVAKPDRVPTFARECDEVRALYRLMVLTRLFDKKAVALQRTGKLGTFASSYGEEAVGTGIGFAMAPDDVLTAHYRVQAAYFHRGVRMEEMFLYWGGSEEGNCFKDDEHDLPFSVPIGTHMSHGAGIAFAMKYREERRAVVAVCGDGATSKPDFGDALNFAAVHKLPVVFVVVNNEWAISVPRKAQTVAETLGQKGLAYGIPSICRVDGNDVIAVRHIVETALADARNGAGPVLIEALTYRLGDHTTADDARRYRSEEEVAQALKREPIARLRTAMERHYWWNQAREQQLVQEISLLVEESVALYFEKAAHAAEAPEEMITHLYKNIPQALVCQRDELAARKGEYSHGQ